jgi:ABC-type amino acid transport substrate-binding protein
MRHVTGWLVRHQRLASNLAIAGFALFAAWPVQASNFGVPENLPPWGLTQDLPAGQRGIYADLAAAIAARTHAPLEIKFVPYGRMLQGIKSGDLDFAFGVIGPATSEAGTFTSVVGKVPMVAVARKGLSLKTLNDLHGFAEVGYLRGGSCGPAVDADAAIKRVAQDSYDSAIRKMAAGRLDAWCSAKPGFTYALGALKMGDEMGDQVDYGEVKIAFQVTSAKTDSAEAHELGGIVDQLVSDGTAGKIFTRYVGAPYTP